MGNVLSEQVTSSCERTQSLRGTMRDRFSPAPFPHFPDTLIAYSSFIKETYATEQQTTMLEAEVNKREDTGEGAQRRQVDRRVLEEIILNNCKTVGHEGKSHEPMSMKLCLSQS